MEPDLAEAIDRYHQSLSAFVQGDSEPTKPLWSRRDDVTLANPFGPPARGWRQVEQVMDAAASALRDGEYRPERISEYATPDLAYILEIERAQAKVGGSGEVRPFSLRVTTVWRREDGEWRILHRHADPITAPRPVESVFES